MKLPSTDPLALAALEIAKETLDRRDPKNSFLFKGNLDDFDFQFTGNGQVGIKTAAGNRKALTLSLKAHFATPPIVLVKASTGKIFLGPKVHMISDKVKKSEAYKLLETTKLKGYSPSSL